ncbi:MAG: polymer-forming cytoskeletal protein [bacterium]
MISKGIETIIGKSCEVKGGLNAKGGIRVDGHVKGNVISEDTVIIGQHAVVKGDLSGTHVVIAGIVTGNVIAKTKLEILHTGKLYGEIKSPKIVMDEGVVFEGSCEMEKNMPEIASLKK